MRTDHYLDSHGEGKIHYCQWAPETEPKAVVQIVHGIAEHVLRYAPFAEYLNTLGYLVVAEDHMGHGTSGGKGCTKGYFAGGWDNGIADTVELMKLTMAEHPGKPYVLFGHSMGSFMARTILGTYPEAELAGAVICGTGWMNPLVLQAGKLMAQSMCKQHGDKKPNKQLHNLMFGSYNRKVEHPRTEYDWLTRDDKIVDAYVADENCGFMASAGLVHAMLSGIIRIQKQELLKDMNKDLPVFFIAGGDDPVGDYGAGVRKAAAMFRKAGMQKVSERIYPLCRHEILNEINRQEIWEDVAQWLEKVCFS